MIYTNLVKTIRREFQPRSALVIGNKPDLVLAALRQAAIVVRHLSLDDLDEASSKQYDIVIAHNLSVAEAKKAAALLVRTTGEILFLFPDSGRKTFFVVELARLLFQHGFFHDANFFDAASDRVNVIRFCIVDSSMAQVIGSYENLLQQAKQEAEIRRKLNLEQREELARLSMKEAENESLKVKIKQLEMELAHIEASIGWSLVLKLQQQRSKIAPSASVRDQVIEDIFRAAPEQRWKVIRESTRRLYRELVSHTRGFIWRKRLQLMPPPSSNLTDFDAIETRPPVEAHRASAAIVVCVHNALDDVQRCLESLVTHSNRPYKLILVDDGSAPLTRDYLAHFAQDHKAMLLRNEGAQGYTFAANKGMREAKEYYVILLNSDTIVTEGWVDRMIACAETDERIGVVGPLSNTASWQSIPQVSLDGDWADNPLPEGMSVERMGRLVAEYSGRLYPSIPFLNGFCLMIRRQVLGEIGYFDEEDFGAGYGEEDDFTIRARQAGWKLALADDVYVYHAQSRSYSTERRQKLSKRAGKQLADKHGSEIIRSGVEICRRDSIFEGIRIRSQRMLERQEWIEKGRAQFKGRRILFVLPVAGPGGGGNVVIDEATAMHKMGVDVRLFNIFSRQKMFEKAYPHLEIPTLFGEISHLSTLSRDFDAVVATFNTSVGWLAPIIVSGGFPARGYYIQGFEPLIYVPGSENHERALASYSLIPELIRFTKTEWTCNEVKKHTGVDSAVIGVSLNTDLFRPRSQLGSDYPERPLRIAAMVRANSPYRAPELTMKLLRQAAKRYKRRVEIVVFGISLNDPDFARLPHNFPMTLAGIINQKKVARLLNEVDIFIDVSSHQAMGLTALEAMACGAAVIVPQNGGAVSFARHEENSLVLDTASQQQCWEGLQGLIEDDDFRSRLQRQAILDVSQYYPERPAFNILQTLFEPAKEGNV